MVDLTFAQTSDLLYTTVTIYKEGNTCSKSSNLTSLIFDKNIDVPVLANQEFALPTILERLTVLLSYIYIIFTETQ